MDPLTPISLMNMALEEARQALAEDEVPIGCIIAHVPSGRIIARAHNRRHNDRDPTAHAEILAMRRAAGELSNWRLNDCVLAVTLEPCAMCAGAMVNARLGRLIYGCDDPKAGAVRSLYQICDDGRLNHRIDIEAGVLADPCARLLQSFFHQQRALGKK